MAEITFTLSAPELDDFNREIKLTCQNKKLMEFLDRRAMETGTATLAEAEAKAGAWIEFTEVSYDLSD